MERIRMLAEKENHKYFGIIVDTIKCTEMKEKVRKGASEEKENFLNPSSAVKISSKE